MPIRISDTKNRKIILVIATFPNCKNAPNLKSKLLFILYATPIDVGFSLIWQTWIFGFHSRKKAWVHFSCLLQITQKYICMWLSCRRCYFVLPSPLAPCSRWRWLRDKQSKQRKQRPTLCSASFWFGIDEKSLLCPFLLGIIIFRLTNWLEIVHISESITAP